MNGSFYCVLLHGTYCSHLKVQLYELLYFSLFSIIHACLYFSKEGEIYEYTVYAEEYEICPLNSAITIPGKWMSSRVN